MQPVAGPRNMATSPQNSWHISKGLQGLATGESVNQWDSCINWHNLQPVSTTLLPVTVWHLETSTEEMQIICCKVFDGCTKVLVKYLKFYTQNIFQFPNIVKNGVWMLPSNVCSTSLNIVLNGNNQIHTCSIPETMKSVFDWL